MMVVEHTSHYGDEYKLSQVDEPLLGDEEGVNSQSQHHGKLLTVRHRPWTYIHGFLIILYTAIYLLLILFTTRSTPQASRLNTSSNRTRK